MTNGSTMLYTHTMKAIELANKYEVHETLISHIRHNRKYTDNLLLAKDMAALTGRKPIDFVRPKIKALALAAHPELNTVHKRKVANKA